MWLLMGRVNSQSPAAVAVALKHFSHPHELLPVDVASPRHSLCSGCGLQSSATMYACLPCNFALHQSCAKLPRRITHPCHRGCTLSLHTTPPYEGGAFSCDACSLQGDAWSYHCAGCEYDLHVTCACKPLEARHPAHASCQLSLTFKNPYADTAGFSCDVCRRIGSKQWLYRCDSCQFDVHLDCISAAAAALQHQHSLPAGPLYPPPHPPPQLPHSASTGGGGINNPGGMGMGMGSNLMMAAMQGFVEGAFQGIGETIVQDVITQAGGGSEGAFAMDAGGESYASGGY
ncbi:uncharacterized protein LOC127240849 [Andrographis paniculata]|uniref:uncharacterized protein LOC127240849 n=1 Tax=Andrographis paniculata TaxID=175694 RepID=UPI0021E93437|nr:uncharacterized protein LOC127240849 [Andrographis paniculata]